MERKFIALVSFCVIFMFFIPVILFIALMMGAGEGTLIFATILGIIAMVYCGHLIIKDIEASENKARQKQCACGTDHDHVCRCPESDANPCTCKKENECKSDKEDK